MKYRPAPKKELLVKQDNTGPIKTVTIGTQVWMLENLNVSVFKNGVAIPEVQDNDAWKNAGRNQQPAWCYYDNDPKNGAKFGKLYNWYAVIDNNGLCPQGWHVPTDAEWDTLVAYLGGEDIAGAKMKANPVMKKEDRYYETGGYYDTKSCSNCSTASAEYKKICPVCKGVGRIKTNKFIPKGKEKYVHEEQIGGWNGTNESGFTGLPGGNRSDNGYYESIGSYGYWWSSTENNSYDAWNRFLHSDGGDASRFELNDDKGDGSSVRCLRD